MRAERARLQRRFKVPSFKGADAADVVHDFLDDGLTSWKKNAKTPTGK
jgi:hypothetical protein